VNPSLSRSLDQLIAERDALNEQIAERERRMDVVNEFVSTAFVPYQKPRRPVAGNATENTAMLNEAQRRELATDTDAELAAVARESLDDIERVQLIERRRDIRRAEALATASLENLRRVFPNVADTVAHAALRFAVSWLGCNHGREFVDRRVGEILDAKLDG